MSEESEPAPEIPFELIQPGPAVLGRAPLADEPKELRALGACFLDETITADLYIKAGMRPQWFHNHAHAVTWAAMLKLRESGKPITPETIGEAIGAPLEKIGGYVFLKSLTDAAPTTIYAQDDLQTVREFYKKRLLAREAQRLLESAYDADTPAADAISSTEGALRLVSKFGGETLGARSIMELTATDDERRLANLLGDGFLRRKQGLLFPGPTGIGKSSSAMQAAICWAIAEPFFGIKSQGPLASLIVQAENDDIDLVEMRDGICAGLNLNPVQRDIVARRVHILTAHERGAALFRRLDPEITRLKIDLLIIDPLFAYMEGAVKDQEDASAFLRGIVQPFLVRHNIAAFVLHHTNKPPSGREKSIWQAGDFAYSGSGSIEFANWARAVIVLRSIGKPDVFELLLPKRGKRAGIADPEGNPITSLFVRHARDKGAIYWELASADESHVDEADQEAARIVREFCSLDNGDGVDLARLAKRLKCSARTLRRRFDDQGELSGGDETLILRNGTVFSQED